MYDSSSTHYNNEPAIPRVDTDSEERRQEPRELSACPNAYSTAAARDRSDHCPLINERVDTA